MYSYLPNLHMVIYIRSKKFSQSEDIIGLVIHINFKLEKKLKLYTGAFLRFISIDQVVFIEH